MSARLSVAAILISLPLAFVSVPAAAQAGATLDAARAAMVRDPHEVVKLVTAARRQIGNADSRNVQLEIARADWLEAEARGRLGQYEDAAKLNGRALAATARLDPRGKLHGDVLMTSGGIALDENRIGEAFDLFRRAHDIFSRLNETRSQAIALQNIGTIYSFAGDQRSVLRYYAQAREVHPGDPALSQAAANNLGIAHRELKDFARAEAEFRRAVALARDLKSPVLEARALNNLASTALLRGNLRETDAIADRGLQIARSSDAAEWVPYLWGVKAQAALARGDLAGAIRLFGRTFAGTDLKTTSFYYRDFHQSAAEAFRRAGEAALAFEHLAAFKRLDDEAREIRSTTNAALAAAQFDFSAQELRITRLREGQLARDIKIERARARQQLILLIGTGALLAVTMVALFWIRRSRNETRVANRELATTNIALDQALQAKSEFLATTSHEIRTPLNGILGMTQVMLGRRSLDQAVRDQVRLIDSAGNTMKAIVDDILDMSQIERGEVQIDRTSFDFCALMREIADLWRAAAEAKGLAFDVDLSKAPAFVEEDERKLRQIGFNLLSNAVKFTRTGMVRLRVSTVQDGGSESLLLAIEDTGIGIPASQHQAIFEPFKQADSSTSREFGGTGLGLAISTKLAHALDGSVDVISEPGVGSVFTLKLPLRRVEAGPAQDHGIRPTTLAMASVVIVEDNPLFASMIESCLADARETHAVDNVDGVPAHADVVVLCGMVTRERAAAVQLHAANARTVVLGVVEPGVEVDAIQAFAMPPLDLSDAIEALLAEPGRAAAA